MWLILNYRICDFWNTQLIQVSFDSSTLSEILLENVIMYCHCHKQHLASKSRCILRMVSNLEEEAGPLHFANNVIYTFQDYPKN